MEEERNEDNVYVRHVECTWVAHSFPNYWALGKDSQLIGNPNQILTTLCRQCFASGSAESVRIQTEGY
jgi:hypothetical protein